MPPSGASASSRAEARGERSSPGPSAAPPEGAGPAGRQRATVSSLFAPLQACWGEEAARAAPAEAVTVEISIDRREAEIVRAITATEGTISAPFAACLRSVMRRAPFDAVDPPFTTLIVPMRFVPTRAPAGGAGPEQ